MTFSKRQRLTYVFGRLSNRWAELDSDEKPFTDAEAAYFNDSATFAYESFRNKVPALSCLLGMPRYATPAGEATVLATSSLRLDSSRCLDSACLQLEVPCAVWRR